MAEIRLTIKLKVPEEEVRQLFDMMMRNPQGNYVKHADLLMEKVASIEWSVEK